TTTHERPVLGVNDIANTAVPLNRREVDPLMKVRATPRFRCEELIAFDQVTRQSFFFSEKHCLCKALTREPKLAKGHLTPIFSDIWVRLKGVYIKFPPRHNWLP